MTGPGVRSPLVASDGSVGHGDTLLVPDDGTGRALTAGFAPASVTARACNSAG